MPSPRLIVFDLDGTLVDSRRDLAESANAVLAEHGCVPQSEEALGRMVGDGAATLIARAFAAARCPEPPGALERFLAIYNGRLLRFTRPYEGITDVLDGLAGRATLAVLTNKPSHSTRDILAGLDLAKYFHETRVLGGDGPWPRKPDPAGLRHLAAAGNLTLESTTLIGDSVVDFQTARAAGVRICLAGYGFGFEGFPVDQLAVGDTVVEGARELLAVL
jgi:phosphoglycolate phosphatase